MGSFARLSVYDKAVGPLEVGIVKTSDVSTIFDAKCFPPTYHSAFLAARAKCRKVFTKYVNNTNRKSPHEWFTPLVCQILEFGYGILDFDFCILDLGFQKDGVWILIFGFLN